MAQPRELTIDTPDVRLRARVWGPDEAPPVLALHGWLDNAASFDRIAPLVPAVRLVALDLPGHGLSDHLPAGATYLFVDHVACVHAAVLALGLGRLSLLGHSLGAAVASILAGTIPERVERVALIEGLGPLAEPAADAPARLQRALTDEHEKRGRTPSVHPTAEAAIDRLARATGMPPDCAAVLASRGLEPVAGGVRWRSDPRLRWPSRIRLSEDTVQAFLRRIACPVLVIRGDRGSPFSPRAGSERLGVLADARLVECPGGHHLHLQSPEPVADALRSFFGAE